MLLITKQPYQWIQDVDDETLAYTFVIAKKLIRHIKEKLGVEYVHVVVE